jgi:predicted protein tyrosine phosphatase
MSAPFDLTICGVMELGRVDRSAITHAITIWHPDAATGEHIELVREAFAEALVHSTIFDDVEYEHGGYQPASPETIREVLDFGAGLTSGSHLLVHCMAGISRSTACAIAILADHLGPGHERRAAEIVRQLRPQARPNRLVLGHADRLLGRDGALLDACDRLFSQPLDAGLVNKGWEDLDDAEWK